MRYYPRYNSSSVLNIKYIFILTNLIMPRTINIPVCICFPGKKRRQVQTPGDLNITNLTLLHKMVPHVILSIPSFIVKMSFIYLNFQIKTLFTLANE